MTTATESGGGGGSVTVEARVPGAHKPTSTLRLIARGDGEWGWEDETLDENSPIILVADASDVEAGGEGCHRRLRWKVELRVYDNVDTTRWMEVLGERVIGDVPFNQIGLPGEMMVGGVSRGREEVPFRVLLGNYQPPPSSNPLTFYSTPPRLVSLSLLPPGIFSDTHSPPHGTHTRHARFRNLRLRSGNGRKSRQRPDQDHRTILPPATRRPRRCHTRQRLPPPVPVPIQEHT